MAIFKVGQRVRIVGAVHEDMKRFIGREGRVTRRDDRGYYTVDSAARDPNDGCELLWHSTHLSPIHSQPERNTVVSWEDLDLPFDPRRVLEGVS